MQRHDNGGAMPETSREDRFGTELLGYWQVLVDRRRVVFITLAGVLLGALLLTLTATPAYLATTTLEIDRQAPEILEFTDVVGIDPAGYRDFYQTQYKLLQSRAVLGLAIERLDLINRPEYAGRSVSPARRALRWAKSLVTDVGQPDPLDTAARFIEESLSIAPIRQSHLVRVHFLDRDPELAADVANAVAEAYQDFQLDARYGMTGRAKEWLTKDAARVRSEIDELGRTLQSYGEEKGLLGLSDGYRDISEQALADINSAYTAARGRLAAAQARYDAVQSADPAGLPEVARSATIAQLRQQYGDLERREAQMVQRFAEDWPLRVELRRELAKTREQLTREMENIAAQVRSTAAVDYERAGSEVDNLQRQRASQKTEVLRVNRDTIEYGSLQAEIRSKRAVLDDLMARQSETEASYRLRETKTSNMRVVDRAEPPVKPARPRKAANMLLAGVFGCFLGVGLAFLVHHLDDTVKSEEDVRRITRLPVLGHIPLTESDPGAQEMRTFVDDTQRLDLASHIGPRTSFAENFRSLRTSLLLASADHPPQRITITSCEPGEGKSTVALNLAIVLTQMGRSVLLVDADLRRPRLHKSLDLSNEVGLSSYLSGNAPASEILQETEIPGLLAITSGPIPPNPSELLGSPALQAVAEQLIAEHGFDHILFDSPPVLSVTDSTILSAHTDATILLVRVRRTRRDGLLRSVGRLRHARANVVGVALNAVSHSATSGYHYYYGSYGQDSEGAGKTAVAGRRTRRRTKRRQAS